MFRTALVMEDIEAGRRILDALAKAGIDINAAFWFHFDEEDSWRLVLVSPAVDIMGPRQLYALVRGILATDPHEQVQISLDQILFVTPYNLLYQQVKSGTGLRIAAGPPRHVMHEDVYVYKI